MDFQRKLRSRRLWPGHQRLAADSNQGAPGAIHMAGHPLLRSESSPSSPLPDNPASPPGNEPNPADAERDVTDLAQELATHTKGAASADLALDLILHEIVEQARLATTATGAAIALVREEELVCRATTGASAPDLGVRLTTRSGLSGACLQTGEVQRCDDATADPRVDAEACRRLRISSILTIPLQDGDTLLGIFAIFSDRTRAFGEREVQTLEAFSGRIVRSVRGVSENKAQATPEPNPNVAEPSAAVSSLETAEPALAPVRRRNYWTDLLSVAIVALTLLLGWMLGRASWKRAFPAAQQPAAVSSKPADISPAPVTQGAEGGAAASATPAVKTPASAPTAGGMVVYQNGKVIFRMPPAEAASGVHTAGAQPSPKAAVATPADASLLTVPPEVAEALLVHRVEPQYPDEAKQSGVQGEVVLQTVIGADGAVKGITTASGDSRLASAAMDAVRQWRFKPYVQNGRSIDVQTQITLKFVLP